VGEHPWFVLLDEAHVLVVDRGELLQTVGPDAVRGDEDEG
jgi:hypothetical protein